MDTAGAPRALCREIVVPRDPGGLAGPEHGVARALARRLGARVAETTPAGPHPAATVLASTAPGTLLCLGTGGLARTGTALARPLAEEALRRTTRPVLTVGPDVVVDPPPAFHTIVACVDDAPLSARSVPVLADWSAALGVTPHLVHVTTPAGPEPPRRPAPRVLAPLVDDLDGRGFEVVTHVLRHGDIAAELLRFVGRLRHALVVLTTHGRSDLRRSALGEVAAAVADRCRHPVLFVPSGPYLGRSG
jgi:nucleotide-binding universal stress UspA family protein